MPLFTDGVISSTEDLRVYETQVLDVAHTEGVELAAKLDLAQREIGVELTAFLLGREYPLGSDRSLRNVVVTEALRQWHALHTLALLYRDAYNSQLHDRYLGKWREYAQLSRRAMDLLYEIGVGVVASPIPQAPAPSVGSTAGGVFPEETYFARMAWQDPQGYTGALSAAAVFKVSGGRLLTAAAGATPPATAGRWLLFAGYSDSDLRLQTAAPLAANDVWTMPETGLVTGLATPPLQTPDAFVTRRRDLTRG